jgi:hypothetical protein
MLGALPTVVGRGALTPVVAGGGSPTMACLGDWESIRDGPEARAGRNDIHGRTMGLMLEMLAVPAGPAPVLPLLLLLLLLLLPLLLLLLPLLLLLRGGGSTPRQTTSSKTAPTAATAIAWPSHGHR